MPELTKHELRQQRAVRAAVLRAARGASPDAPPNEIRKFTYTGPSDEFMEKFDDVADNKKVFNVRLKSDPEGDLETDFLVYASGKDKKGKMHTTERDIAAVIVKSTAD
jgi:hypothetical protein